MEYRDAELGERFGPLWATYWFRVEATVPEEWAGERVDLLWVSHSEATLWIAGRPVQGLTRARRALGSTRPSSSRRPAASGSTYASSWPATASSASSRGPTRRSSRSCSTAAGSPASTAGRGTCTTTSTSSAGSRRTPSTGLDESWAGRLLSELNRFCNVWVEPRPLDLGRGRGDPDALLGEPNGSHAHEISAMGHAHIDTAWLWPLAETQRKLGAPSARRPPTWSAIRSSGSPARRPSSTTGSARGAATCTSASSRHAEAGKVAARGRHVGRAGLQPAVG